MRVLPSTNEIRKQDSIYPSVLLLTCKPLLEYSALWHSLDVLFPVTSQYHPKPACKEGQPLRISPEQMAKRGENGGLYPKQTGHNTDIIVQGHA